MSESKRESRQKAGQGKGGQFGKKKPAQARRLYGEAPPAEMDVVLGVRKLVLRADKTSNYQYWSEGMEKYFYRHCEDVGAIIRLEKHHVFEPPKADLAAMKALKAR